MKLQPGQIRVPSLTRWCQRNLLQTLAKVAPSLFSKSIPTPCFLVGCPRSGTSFFDQVFASHPAIASYPSEALDLWHPQAYPWRQAAKKASFPPIWGDAKSFTEYSLDHRSPADGRHLMASFQAYMAFAKGSQFVNKCTLIGLMLPYALALFPDAKFVHVVRDGRSSALSWARYQRHGIEAHPEVFDLRGWNKTEQELLLLCAATWQTIVNSIEEELSDLDDSQHLTIRYEDFCEDPNRELARAAELLGLSTDKFSAERVAAVRSQNYKFADRVGADIRLEIQQMLAETLAKFGYTVDSS